MYVPPEGPSGTEEAGAVAVEFAGNAVVPDVDAPTSLPVRLIFGSSTGARAQPNTVQPPFSV
jgi:hypothetical protein